jgi:demethylmenaquinone methyltransferase/2-methoxy-6-polyprenyl-1,4-benzoquinol methylase
MEELLAPVIAPCETYLAGRDILEIACGTGNWTQVLSKRGRSVVATDVNRSVLDLARAKPFDLDNVEFRIADAYELEQVDGTFDAAFAADWWSHMPKSSIPGFLRGLASRLRSGSPVVIVDMLPIKNLTRLGSRYDGEGNFLHKRKLPSGEEFEVVKNFPAERELRDAVAAVATPLGYSVYERLRRWTFIFRTA